MNKFNRGLLALVLSCFIVSSLQADYLYKDEVIYNQKLSDDIEKIGKELHDKTGIALRLVILQQLDENQTIVDYEKNLAKSFNEPTILLTFSEINQKVDILARPESLYKYFDKKQVLSPTASRFQAVIMAVLFSRSYDEFKSNLDDFGGTIIPILAEKTKGVETLQKYSAALFNGYADIADQVAASHGVTLQSDVGNSNRYTIEIVKIVFYLIVLYGIVMYVRRKFAIKKLNNEKK